MLGLTSFLVLVLTLGVCSVRRDWAISDPSRTRTRTWRGAPCIMVRSIGCVYMELCFSSGVGVAIWSPGICVVLHSDRLPKFTLGRSFCISGIPPVTSRW